MTVKYNVVSYFIGEGIRNVFKNKKSTMSAITVMFLCMLIFGVFFIIGENINHIMSTVEEAQGVQVYFKVGTTEERISEIGEEIKKIEGINNVQFISSEDGFNEMKENLKNNPKALEGFNSELLPDSYRVTLSNLELNEQIQKKITEIVGEDMHANGIRSSNETIATIMKIGRGIRYFTFALLVILANTIKLTVHARRKEISIMKYVGATNSFIRGPFIVEGIFIGLIAAGIAILIVGMIYNGVIPNAEQSEVVKKLEITLYLILGMGIGVLGSSISMRKYLEV